VHEFLYLKLSDRLVTSDGNKSKHWDCAFEERTGYLYLSVLFVLFCSGTDLIKG
jgi:hypothetical protein